MFGQENLFSIKKNHEECGVIINPLFDGIVHSDILLIARISPFVCG